MKIKKERPNIFKSKPWKSQEEYFRLGDIYKCWGKELEQKIKEELRKQIPVPTIREPF